MLYAYKASELSRMKFISLVKRKERSGLKRTRRRPVTIRRILIRLNTVERRDTACDEIMKKRRKKVVRMQSI